MAKISIGLPVFNGENYISESITSILNQTFTDFELIISDNASSDNTRLICLEFQLLDSRIKYHRQEYNIGINRNFQFVLLNSKSDFFIWASHDDIWDLNWLTSLYNISKKYNTLTYGKVQFINDNGDFTNSTVNLREMVYTSKFVPFRLFKFICDPWLIGKMLLFHGLYPKKLISNSAIDTLTYGNFNNDLYFVYEVLKNCKIKHANVLHYKRVHTSNDSILNSTTIKNISYNKYLLFLKNLFLIKYYTIFFKKNDIMTKLYFILYTPLIPYYILKNIFYNFSYHLKKIK